MEQYVNQNLELFKEIYPEVSDYLLGLDRLYLPLGFSEKLESVTNILVTPTYISVTFNCDGIDYRIYRYYGEESVKNNLYLAEGESERAVYTPKTLKIGNKTIYSSYILQNAYYKWVQDDTFYVLRIYDTKQDDRFFDLCDIEEYKLSPDVIDPSAGEAARY